MPDPPVRVITVSLVRRFVYSFSGQELRPWTIRGALHALHALFAYVKQMGGIPENPAASVRLPKRDAANRLTVTDEDLLKLLEAAERQHSDFRAVRDRAVLADRSPVDRSGRGSEHHLPLPYPASHAIRIHV